MNISRTLWRIQIVSVRNGARYDARTRFIFVLVTLFDMALGYWSGSQLLSHIEQWKALGPLALHAGLWSICLLTWIGMSFVAKLQFLQQGLGDDATLLLFTLPIVPATRFRAQFGLFFITRLWNWLLLETCITGWVLFVTLGWPQALSWLLLLQFGVGCAVYAAMVVLTLVICYILPYLRVKARLALWTMLALALILALALFVHPQWGTQAINSIASVAGATNTLIASYLGWLKPEFASLLFALLLLLALGPLARWSGNVYTAAFLVTQSWDRSQRAFYVPGVRILSRLMAQQRTLTGALLVKGLLNQSRNFLFWARLVIIVIALLFFQQVQTIVTTHGFSDTFFTIGYASALAFLITLEQAPNALSGEGNRLSLYLTAPFSSANIFRAKLAAFLLPTTLVGLATDLLLSWSIGLPMSIMAYSAIATVMVIIGCLALPVLGSIWEENLNLPVEGAVQVMLQEEAAISPKRLLLVYLSLVVFAGTLLILWKLPPLLAIATLLLLDVTIMIVMLHWSRTYLRHLLQIG